MSRRLAREQVFTLLFQIDFTDSFEEGTEQIERYLAQYPDIESLDTNFILEELEGIRQHQDKIDTTLEKYSEGWKVTRMGKVDRAILRLAVYEIFYATDIPVSVSINEAVELAKKFGEDSSPSFINAVLGKIVQQESLDGYDE
ncbi:MAG: transcription antitermination factor NusB [Epulopiscium sp.]|nr:transcription antitermination factor NusB [Candidatus Epulonipiscium sp.]